MNKKFLAPEDSDFSEIIKEGCYYVDKTHLIYQLVSKKNKGTSRRNYFLSRPRRFGKSLLIDTMHCLFEGKKELFKDLYIYDKWNFEENTHPVIKINLASGNYTIKKGFEKRIQGILASIERVNQTPDFSNSTDYISRFETIIYYVYQKHNKQVVVLIDEYDKPILNALGVNQKTAESNRLMLSDFFGVLKDYQQYIRFVFITGISMFPKADMSSGLNNVTNISLKPEYATICGFTEKELKSVFAPELQSLKNISFAKIKKYYNGYNWSGDKQNKVYNPFGIINLFSEKFIDSWWYDTSRPNFLYKILGQKYITPKDVGDQWIDKGILTSINKSPHDYHSLLFQMGVLTIVGKKYFKNTGKTQFLLDYPNLEVKNSFTSEYVSYFIGSDKYTLSVSKAELLIEFLEKNDLDKFQQTLHSLFADIPFPWTNKLIYQQINKQEDIDPSYFEGFYAALIYVSFIATGLQVSREHGAYKGSSDIEVDLGNQVFVLELKVLRDKDIEKIAQQALTQIQEKGYGDRHSYSDKKVFGVALVFDYKISNIVGLKHKLIYDGSS